MRLKAKKEDDANSIFIWLKHIVVKTFKFQGKSVLMLL